MIKKISLPWMDKIRVRLDEYEDDSEEKRTIHTLCKRDLGVINEFLEPIMEYREQQEALIPKLQKKSKEEWLKEFERLYGRKVKK